MWLSKLRAAVLATVALTVVGAVALWYAIGNRGNPVTHESMTDREKSGAPDNDSQGSGRDTQRRPTNKLPTGNARRANENLPSGKLTDRGPLAFSPRYVLDLAEIDVTKGQAGQRQGIPPRPNKDVVGQYTFSLRDLPVVEFTVGFNVTKKGGGNIGELGSISPPLSATVRMTMVNDRGDKVMVEEAPLSQWRWSGGDLPEFTFVYRHGKVQEIPIGDGRGSVENRRIGFLADGGWGTAFRPREGTRYQLAVEILKADSRGWTTRSHCEPRVVVGTRPDRRSSPT